MIVNETMLEKVYDSDIDDNGFCLMPNGLIKINHQCFEDLRRLEEVHLYDGIEEIDYMAFNNCQKLESIILPANTLKKIGDFTFAYCISLETLDLGNCITEIGYGAFNGCWSLRELKIPNTVKHIDISMFDDCENLKRIEWKGKVYSYDDLISYERL